MVLKGIVSSIEDGKVRVTFPDKENDVSAPLPMASHVTLLEVGNRVVVIFFSPGMVDGLIIAKF